VRSLCTISLIALIGLASYGNVYAQNPQAPSGLPWCTTQPGAGVPTTVTLPTIPDPAANTSSPGYSNYVYNSMTGIQSGNACTVNSQASFCGPVDNLGDQPNVPCSNTNNSACLQDPNNVILAINAARAKEFNSLTGQHLGNLILPGAPNFPDYYQYLTQDEKLVVLINLERQDRGLAPFPIQDQYPPAPYGNPALAWEAHNHAAVLAEFYQLAQLGLVHENSIDGQITTAGPTNRITSIPGFTQGTLTPSPVYEAEAATQNAENAVYGLLYQDGPSNWGHRHGLLGVYDTTGGDHCSTQIGAGFAASANEAVYLQNQFNQVQNPVTPYAPPPTFFYIVELVGQETSGWQLPSGQSYVSNTASSIYPNTVTPSPLAATVVYNPPSPGSPPPGVSPPGSPSNAAPPAGSLSVYIGWQGYPFGGFGDKISSVYVYPNPQWGEGYTTDPTPGPNVCPSGQACSSPLGAGALGSGGIQCNTPGGVGQLATGWGVYLCTVPVPPTTPLVVIARDAYDQFVCLQPSFSQTFPLIDQLPVGMLPTSSGGTVTSVGVSLPVAADSCGVVPVLPYAASSSQ
jgi:hypothetical protein